jgi:hypothetical protein
MKSLAFVVFGILISLCYCQTTYYTLSRLENRLAYTVPAELMFKLSKSPVYIEKLAEIDAVRKVSQFIQFTL